VEILAGVPLESEQYGVPVPSLGQSLRRPPVAARRQLRPPWRWDRLVLGRICQCMVRDAVRRGRV